MPAVNGAQRCALPHRRRKELLRRKRAALRSLQALVKMGGAARRAQLAALRMAADHTVNAGKAATAAGAVSHGDTAVDEENGTWT